MMAYYFTTEAHRTTIFRFDLRASQEYNHYATRQSIKLEKDREVTPLRPKNLNLFTIRFPIPALISILHRLSGAFLFLLIPFALWGLNVSLTESGYEQITQYLDTFCAKIILWFLLMPFCYHFAAGIRHLLMDIHIGTSLQAGRKSAQLTLVISILLVILVGVWLW